MSFMFAQPQLLMEAASDLAGIGSTLSAANSAAALPISSVMAAGADEVSAAMAAVFGAHAQNYQAMSAKAADLHSQFVQAMNSAGNAYSRAESANASPLQGTDGAGSNTVGARAQGLLGGPGMGGQARMGQGGGPMVGSGGGARTGSLGRSVGSTVPTGGAGGFGGVGRGSEKQAQNVARGLIGKPDATFGPGGPGGVGTARDLRATHSPDGSAAKQTFATGGSGAGGRLGSGGSPALSATAEPVDGGRLRPVSDRLRQPPAEFAPAAPAPRYAAPALGSAPLTALD